MVWTKSLGCVDIAISLDAGEGKKLLIGWSGASEANYAINHLYSGQILCCTYEPFPASKGTGGHTLPFKKGHGVPIVK
jgi:hypothetical protein